jgi:hypothetical protein
MNNITDLINPDFSANNNQLAKEMVDFGLQIYRGMTARNAELQRLYRMYHGRYSKKEKTALTNVHGRTSATEFTAYRLAKVKIDQLLGESLEVGFNVEVDTISPVEKQNKQNKMLTDIGRSAAKPFIQTVQRQGFNIYDGVRIPDYQQGVIPDLQEYRTRNEMISQRIQNEKVKDAIKNNIYYYLFSSNLFASEIFTRCYMNEEGRTGLEVIQPERMIYPLNNYDQFGMSAPILGHWWHGTFAEIVRKFNIVKDSEEWKQLVANIGSNVGSAGVEVLLTADGEYDFENASSTHTPSKLYATVYEFQWRYYVDKIVKSDIDGNIHIYELDAEEVKMFKKRDIPFETLRFERIYTGSSVNGMLYLGFRDLKDYAVTRDENGKIHANYDYTCTLIKTFGGLRTSFATVVTDLNKQYDKSRWLLVREIKKSKGTAIFINKAFMGLKTKDSVLYELEDQGVLEFDSKERYDETGEGILNGNQVVGSIVTGTGSNLIRDLISICLDLERVLDSVTGMNDSRKGTEMATTTATTAQNNLQASRSVTYDMFYFTENHMERAFTQLIEKTKSVIYAGSREAYSYLPIEDLEYLEQSPDFFKDNFKARIVGGRRSQQIFAELSNVLLGEISAGKRSSRDFAEVKLSDSLAEAIDVLRNSDTRLQTITQQAQQSDQQTKLQLNQQTNQSRVEDREDQQVAKKELQDSINTTVIQNTALKVQAELLKPQLAPRDPVAPQTKKK